jgi:hypothetical protein
LYTEPVMANGATWVLENPAVKVGGLAAALTAVT